MFSRQKLIPTPSYVWPTSPEPDGGVATAVVLSPAGMGARAPLGSIPRLQLHAISRNCLGRCQVNIHHSPFRVRGATSIHTQSQLAGGCTGRRNAKKLDFFDIQVPAAAAYGDRAWTARFLILIRHTRIYYPGYISPNRIKFSTVSILI
jgi:hypothetical protein